MAHGNPETVDFIVVFTVGCDQLRRYLIYLISTAMPGRQEPGLSIAAMTVALTLSGQKAIATAATSPLTEEADRPVRQNAWTA